MNARFVLNGALFLLVTCSSANAVDSEMFCTGKLYGKGKKAICLPLGGLSFADQLVRFTPGKKTSQAPFD